MSHVSTWKCDGAGCKKMRLNDSNNWWTLCIMDTVLTLAHFSEEHINEAANHYCGEDCASQAIQRWMATGKLEPASQVPINPEHVKLTREMDAHYERITTTGPLVKP